MGINMNDIDTLLPTISECALAISETVEPSIAEDQLPTLELDDLIRLQCRLDDAISVVELLQKVIKTEITDRVKGLTGQSYEVPSFNPGKVWRAKMRTRKGSIKLDIQSTKSALVEQGVPIEVVNDTFSANTTKGKDSNYLEIREVKAGSADTDEPEF
jgi:hypothetical protein